MAHIARLAARSAVYRLRSGPFCRREPHAYIEFPPRAWRARRRGARSSALAVCDGGNSATLPTAAASELPGAALLRCCAAARGRKRKLRELVQKTLSCPQDTSSKTACQHRQHRQLHQYTASEMSGSNVALLLAALTAGGGTMGYVRTGSIPSIAAGCTVGALYGLGGYRIRNRQAYGVELALAASLLLAGSSIPRAIRSQKPLPTGLSVLALFGLYTFGSLYRAQL